LIRSPRFAQNSGTDLVVFDLDGTLIDSRRDLADSANALIAEQGGSPLPVDSIAAMVGEGAALLVRRALAAAGLPVDIDRDLPRFLELYDRRLLAHTDVYPGTREMLAAVAARATLAILTNKPQHHTDAVLAGLDLAAHFRWVIGGDTPHGRKPDPRGLQFAIACAGAEPAATLMVGDSAIDLRTARAAGVRCCLVRYGFGFPSAEPLLTLQDRVIDRPEDLIGEVSP
jgi:phosphoglycolate phosphatase